MGPDWSPTHSDTGASRKANSLSLLPTSPCAAPAAAHAALMPSLAANHHVSSPTTPSPSPSPSPTGDPTDTAPSSEAPPHQTLWCPIPMPQDLARPSDASPADHVWPSIAEPHAHLLALSHHRGRLWLPGGDATPDVPPSNEDTPSCGPACPSHGRPHLPQPPPAPSPTSCAGAVPSPNITSPPDLSQPQNTPPPPTLPPSPSCSPIMVRSSVTPDPPARDTSSTGYTRGPSPPPSPPGIPPAAASSRRQSAPPLAPRSRPPPSEGSVCSGTRGRLAKATAPDPRVSAATRGCRTPPPSRRCYPPLPSRAPLGSHSRSRSPNHGPLFQP